jgi:uncharacterized protein YeaO (DUF488 family)
MADAGLAILVGKPGMIPARNVRLKRAYEPASAGDGQRILVDRLWPRGVRKSALKIDDWMKDVAPSGELRAWFGHEPKRWDEFQRRYRRVLSDHAELVSDLRRRARHGPVTLIYSAKDEQHNDAVVLRKTILGRPTP